MHAEYPERQKDRNRWILERRPKRNEVRPDRPVAFLNERERSKSGEIVDVATIFLSNRECPWRCLMCDLWKNTLKNSVQPDDIATQIDIALAQLGSATQLKLYNSGSFFDERAIPEAAFQKIAERANRFDTVIVESHPSLIGDNCLGFRDKLEGQLEVAMGLETADPESLERLNKGMTLGDFERAALFLKDHDIDMRAFVLIKPPFQVDSEVEYWSRVSIDYALACNATAISLIPTRPGNGVLETLSEQGWFSPPKLLMLEDAHDYGVGRAGGRVFADLWDLRQFSDCNECFEARLHRMNQMNLTQRVLPRVDCIACGDGR